jgi:cyclophilin family peptidyl-prolyl cis-trans isomerase
MEKSDILKSGIIILSSAAVLAASAFAVFGMMPSLEINPFQSPSTAPVLAVSAEGPVVSPTIVVGPFDLHRRYRSMEGPYVDLKIRIGDLIASKVATAPEDMVKFIEKGQGAASMMGGAASDKLSSLKDTSKQPRRLYWLKGFKLEVLDENDKVLPTAEFICHTNIDADSAQRNDLFKEATRCVFGRVLTITQGCTDITFPEGYAVPVASDEQWHFIFQAANRSTDEHKRVKHRLTMNLIADQDLVRPITALAWTVPHIEVVVDKDSPAIVAKEKSECPLCIGEGRGVNAPNSTSTSVGSDVYGRKVSGHWVVPPGKSKWATLIRDTDFAPKPRTIRAAWAHIHPFCTDIELVHVSQLNRKVIFDIHAQSSTNPVEIQHIDFISSTPGISLPSGDSYEAVVSYDNPTNQAFDSMATLGIYFDDNDFARPDWALSHDHRPSCAVGDEAGLPPVFDLAKDGPILSKPKTVSILTNAGPLKFQCNPAWAPKTATQLSKLFAAHAFDGTEIKNYVPGFIFQIPLAEIKAPGCAPNTASQTSLVRRIPVEVDAQFSKEVSHKWGALSMARRENDPLDNTTSFSILLGDAPHLNNKFTIFGALTNDPENVKTIEKMKANWPKHPVIIKTLSVS